MIEPDRTVPSEPLALNVSEVLLVSWNDTSPLLAGVTEAPGAAVSEPATRSAPAFDSVATDVKLAVRQFQPPS